MSNPAQANSDRLCTDVLSNRTESGDCEGAWLPWDKTTHTQTFIGTIEVSYDKTPTCVWTAFGEDLGWGIEGEISGTSATSRIIEHEACSYTRSDLNDPNNNTQYQNVGFILSTEDEDYKDLFEAYEHKSIEVNNHLIKLKKDKKILFKNAQTELQTTKNSLTIPNYNLNKTVNKENFDKYKNIFEQNKNILNKYKAEYENNKEIFETLSNENQNPTDTLYIKNKETFKAYEDDFLNNEATFTKFQTEFTETKEAFEQYETNYTEPPAQEYHQGFNLIESSYDAFYNYEAVFQGIENQYTIPNETIPFEENREHFEIYTKAFEKFETNGAYFTNYEIEYNTNKENFEAYKLELGNDLSGIEYETNKTIFENSQFGFKENKEMYEAQKQTYLETKMNFELYAADYTEPENVPATITTSNSGSENIPTTITTNNSGPENTTNISVWRISRDEFWVDFYEFQQIESDINQSEIPNPSLSYNGNKVKFENYQTAFEKIEQLFLNYKTEYETNKDDFEIYAKEPNKYIISPEIQSEFNGYEAAYLLEASPAFEELKASFLETKENFELYETNNAQ